MELAGGDGAISGEKRRPAASWICRLSDRTRVGRTSLSLYDARITRLKIGSAGTTMGEADAS
jgi:hypothetical protein